jgi:hypothetical protein
LSSTKRALSLPSHTLQTVTDVAWSGNSRLCYFAADAPPLRRLGSMPLAALRHLDSNRYTYLSRYFVNWRLGSRQPYGTPVVSLPSNVLPGNGVLLWEQLPSEAAHTREWLWLVVGWLVGWWWWWWW